MKKYNATYEDKNGEIVSTAQFEAENLKGAKDLAQSHKNHTPEITRAKGVKTSVRLSK